MVSTAKLATTMQDVRRSARPAIDTFAWNLMDE
jgi:hypothetical protein